MWRPVNSPDTDDTHVRHLLDQRFARADPFGRYSSSTISEASDTPSVYSRAFSPRPAVHADSLTDNYLHKSPTSRRQFRLYDDPSSSVLDLSEDSHSSMALHQPYDRDDGIDDNKTPEVDEDEDGLPRGPKMRFHSRAPWELEGGSFEEVNESESSGSTTFMAKLTGGRSKGSKADPSSPRPSTSAGRPSLESSRSILNSKRSFDTSSLSHPRGALYALAQESISTSSLRQANYSGCQDRPRGKLSSNRFQSQSPVDINFPGQSVIQDDHSFILPPSPPRPSGETASSALDVQGGLGLRYSQHRSNDDSFHPYANPDLVKSYTTDTRSGYSQQSFIQHPGAFRHDPIMTVTDISSTTLSKFAPPPTPDLPPVPPPKRRNSHVNGRDISSPVPIRSTSLGPDSPSQLHCDSRPEAVSPMLNAIPGWSERSVNPGFSLISLEEARAQRPRPAPVQPPTSSLDSPPSSGGSSTVTSLHRADRDTSTANVFADSDTLYISGGDSANIARRSRARSISAGAKAMNALQSIVKQPERKDSETSPVTGQTHVKDAGSVSGGRNLKHRKSGFLRLFGSSGKEEHPPPVPTIPSQLSTTNSALSESLKPSSRRIPAPNISPSLLDITPQHDSGGSSGSSGRSNSKRFAPSLSINVTSSSSPVSPPPRGSSITAFSSQVTIPQSAPAHASDFPTLKLRPVSSLFSAHFADHIDVTKLSFDNFDGVEPKMTSKTVAERQQERPRQNSLASGSVSSAPSSESGASFADSQYIITSMASSNRSAPVTALTTPTTPGAISPIGAWHRDRGGRRESIDQYSARPSSSHGNSSVAVSTPHIVIDSETSTVKVLQEHLDSTNKMWQKRVWELEKQITQLKDEVAELKKGETHEKGKLLLLPSHQHQTSVESVGGVMNRPRARTGGSSRFVNGQL